ncbi:very short patch repair endonuclease [Dyadobacter sp. CY261]|uniref:very short patch repair endonuclease n=1 Tax=Dyadobacter sp. CY261 TaxID=2907203 RepID=UPI001F1FA53F|nr:very short patch repair endonuclease [Dyadobacter sp. CY261]MCF0075336.1 very short patch repair endonuclease [Dyadobacter sp. CY261]
MTTIKAIEYSRDLRSPVPTTPHISKIMSANKSKNTLPELALRKRLWSDNLRGYRLHPNKIPGRPDIIYPRFKVAIFVNGCFWHRCPYCQLREPSGNRDFWVKKFDANIERDTKKRKLLEEAGWKTITVWECEIKKSIDQKIKEIQNILNE